jgi:chloramphenicol-sensitive protein RarD
LVPIVNILLGVLLLKEKLSKIRLISVGLVIFSVLNLILKSGNLIPWIYLTIALTFGFYGFLRKVAPLGAISGLTVETAILTVPTTVFLITNSNVVWPIVPPNEVWLNYVVLLSIGIVSVFPLLCFSKATTLLKLSTLGFYQYILPTTQLLLAVFVYSQKVSQTTMLNFLLIWLALIFVSLEAALNCRRS